MIIYPHGDGCWPELAKKLADGAATWDQGSLSIARLPMGMKSGGDSVAIRIDLPDGKVHVVQTSLALFTAAAQAFTAAQGAQVGGTVNPSDPTH